MLAVKPGTRKDNFPLCAYADKHTPVVDDITSCQVTTVAARAPCVQLRCIVRFRREPFSILAHLQADVLMYFVVLMILLRSTSKFSFYLVGNGLELDPLFDSNTSK